MVTFTIRCRLLPRQTEGKEAEGGEEEGKLGEKAARKEG